MTKIIIALMLNACIAMPVVAADIYRWTDPETGKVVTTPYPPSYPIKEQRHAGSLSTGNLINVILDTESAQVKALINKRKAKEDQEKRLDAERQSKEAEQKRIIEEQSQKLAAIKEQQKKQICNGDREFGIRIGMRKADFQKCFPYQPSKINTTSYATGTREQWVYPSGYYYFDNEVLTVIQNR